MENYLVVIYFVHFDKHIPVNYLVQGETEKQAIHAALANCFQIPQSEIDYYFLEEILKYNCIYAYDERVQLKQVTLLAPDHAEILKQYL